MNPLHIAEELIAREGISSNAAKVYISLLALGSGNISQIALKTSLHPQSAKNALQELVKQGLASAVAHKLSRSVYRPTPPYVISQRMHERHERYTKILPELQALLRENTTRFSSVYEGKGAFIRETYRLLNDLPSSATLFIAAHPGVRFINLFEGKYEAWEHHRVSKGVGKHALLSKHELHSFRQRPDLQKEARSEYRSHSAIEGPHIEFITPFRLIHFFYDSSEPTTLVIESKEHARQSIRLFTYLWKESEAI